MQHCCMCHLSVCKPGLLSSSNSASSPSPFTAGAVQLPVGHISSQAAERTRGFVLKGTFRQLCFVSMSTTTCMKYIIKLADHGRSGFGITY